jgi:phenylacetate-CoA ligase
MHISAEWLFVESVRIEDVSYCEEGVGDIVVTDMLNYGMPFIRYQIGDIGMVSNESCPCGRELPLVKKLNGRAGDFFFTPQKRQVMAGSLVLYLVDEAPGLFGQVQIIQDKLDHLIIRVSDDFPPSAVVMDYQEKTVKRLFGEKMKVSFETVGKIPVEKSGKYLFTKCLLSEDEVAR